MLKHIMAGASVMAMVAHSQADDMSGGLGASPPVEGGHDNTTNQPMSAEDHAKAFWRGVAKLGAASGEGASALPKLYLAAARAADDGIISAEKPTGPGAKDDATRIYEAYCENDSKKSEHTSGGAKANASKLRQVIQAASMTTCDFVEVCQEVIDTRDRLIEADVKVKALAPAIVDAAREQLKQDTQLSSEAIEDAIRVVPKEKTLEDELKSISKRIDDLVTGEGRYKLKDQDPRTIQVQELLADRIDEFIKLAVERGYTETQALEMLAKK